MLELKIAYKYIIVIIIGIAIFLLDLFNESGSTLNESILILAGLFKSVYFIKFTYIALIVLSFAVDYNCLSRIKETAFSGILPAGNIAKEFIGFLYFSASTFTTAGFGDIKPNDPIIYKGFSMAFRHLYLGTKIITP